MNQVYPRCLYIRRLRHFCISQSLFLFGCTAPMSKTKRYEHCPGSHYVVVSKRAASAGRCVTTVLDVPLRRLYRAAHDTGMACFWKGVAKRRAGAVEYLQAGASFSAPRGDTLELAPPPRLDSWLIQRAGAPDGVQPPV